MDAGTDAVPSGPDPLQSRTANLSVCRLGERNNSDMSHQNWRGGEGGQDWLRRRHPQKASETNRSDPDLVKIPSSVTVTSVTSVSELVPT